MLVLVLVLVFFRIDVVPLLGFDVGFDLPGRGGEKAGRDRLVGGIVMSVLSETDYCNVVEVNSANM